MVGRQDVGYPCERGRNQESHYAPFHRRAVDSDAVVEWRRGCVGFADEKGRRSREIRQADGGIRKGLSRGTNHQVSVISHASRKFWACFQKLPPPVQTLARKKYALWLETPLHPSLKFKTIRPPLWSVRVGDHYRAVGHFMGNVFLWDWIGTHEEYNKRF